jgi:hypothetical protein
MPVGAVAGQAGDVIGEDDADLLLVDERDKLLEARPPFRGPTGASQVGVDDPDLVGIPAGGVGAAAEVLLEFKALLLCQSLVGAGLTDVDDGQATEVGRLNGVGGAHGGLP